jgi:hypothetical protein
MMRVLVITLMCPVLSLACSDASGTKGLTIFGATAYSTFKTSSVSSCCAACSKNVTNCGGWYYHDDSCKLFSLVDKADYKMGNCTKWNPPKNCTSGFPGPPTPTPGPFTPVVVHIDAKDEMWQISPYLATMSLVYSWAPDAIYKNGSMANWAKQNKLATARYPAGEASYYNWENPSGLMGM